MTEQELQQRVDAIVSGEYCNLIFCENGTMVIVLDGHFTASRLLEIGKLLTNYSVLKEVETAMSLGQYHCTMCGYMHEMGTGCPSQGSMYQTNELIREAIKILRELSKKIDSLKGMS